MGCWNGTCALTGLPILEKEKVYAILLGRRLSNYSLDHDNVILPYTSMCYSTDDWQPMGWWFTGTYNGYGSLENCEGMIEETLQLVLDNLVEIPKDLNYRGTGVTKENFNTETLFKASHSGILVVNEQQPQQLKVVFIKENVINRILEEHNPRVHTGNGEYAKLKTKLKKEINNHVKKIHQILSEYEPGLAQLLAKVEAHESFFDPNVTFGQFRDMSHSYFQAIISHDIKLIKSMQHQIIMYGVIESFMSYGRYAWHPLAGEGSQSFETMSQTLLAEITIDEAKVIRKQFEEC